MSWHTELQSWMFPKALPSAEIPTVGQKAPQHAKLDFPDDGKPTIVTFLRHCGCPCESSRIFAVSGRLILVAN